jgi:hypothetical protein
MAAKLWVTEKAFKKAEREPSLERYRTGIRRATPLDYGTIRAPSTTKVQNSSEEIVQNNGEDYKAGLQAAALSVNSQQFPLYLSLEIGRLSGQGERLFT